MFSFFLFLFALCHDPEEERRRKKAATDVLMSIFGCVFIQAHEFAWLLHGSVEIVLFQPMDCHFVEAVRLESCQLVNSLHSYVYCVPLSMASILNLSQLQSIDDMREIFT